MVASIRPLMLLLPLAALLAGCGHKPGMEPSSAVSQSPKAPAAPPVSQELITAALQPWPRVVHVQGSFIADEEAVIGAKVAGRVNQVKVDLGSQVRQGQALTVLDGEDFELRVQQAEAQVAQARSKLGLKADDPDSRLDRLKAPPVAQERALMDEALSNVERGRQLSRQNAFSAEELARREAALRVAEARYATALNTVDEQIAVLAARRVDLAVAKQLQSDAVITAPFDGMIQELHVAPGMYPNVGQPIVTLVRVDPLRYRAGVPEQEALRIEMGQTVRIFLSDAAQPLVATISRISPALDVSSRSLIIEADVPNTGAKLPVGLFAEADIVIDPTDRALAVPASAVTEFAGVEKVRLVRGDREEEQSIHTGRRRGDLVEVLEGLTAGDRIITGSARNQAGVPPRDADRDAPQGETKTVPGEKVKTSLGA